MAYSGEDGKARAELVNAALESVRNGDESALATLFSKVYDELHELRTTSGGAGRATTPSIQPRSSTRVTSS